MPNLLLIEDNRILCLMEARYLLSAFPHITLLTAGTGEEAIGIAEKQPPDIVVMDCHLGDGIAFGALFDALRGIAPDAAVIVVSASPPSYILSRPERYRIVEVIEKPFETEEFISAVGKALAVIGSVAPSPPATVSASDDIGCEAVAPKRSGTFSRHEALNVLAGILVGIRALEADLRAEADGNEAVQSVLDEEVPLLIAHVERAASIIKRAPPDAEPR